MIVRGASLAGTVSMTRMKIRPQQHQTELDDASLLKAECDPVRSDCRVLLNVGVRVREFLRCRVGSHGVRPRRGFHTPEIQFVS